MTIFKQRLTDTFIQNWHSRLHSSTRAVFYRSVAVFQFQPYLEKINISKFQKVFSRLRMSSHRLEIEAGRWARPNSIPLDERKCRTCNAIEDEYHFVIECSLFKEIRSKFIHKYYWKRPSMFKFVDLINSSNQKTIRNLSSFIFQAFKSRTELLYLPH